MSNVLIGIVGLMLFVALALAGASFFGPVMGDSVQEGRANGTLRVLSEVAHAVSARNMEMETSTTAAVDASELVPRYLESVPVNPANGEAVLIVTSQGTIGGPATYTATKLRPSESAMCKFINRAGGGGDTIPTATNLPTQRSGCLKAGTANGPFAAGDYIAYLRIG